MTTELRIYTMHPGKLDEFIDIFTNRIMPTCSGFGIRVHAAWTNREKNEFVWIRSYDDQESLDVYSNSPERAEYNPLSQACIDKQDIRVIEAVVGELPVAN